MDCSYNWLFAWCYYYFTQCPHYLCGNKQNQNNFAMGKGPPKRCQLSPNPPQKSADYLQTLQISHHRLSERDLMCGLVMLVSVSLYKSACWDQDACLAVSNIISKRKKWLVSNSSTIYIIMMMMIMIWSTYYPQIIMTILARFLL